MLLMFYLPKCGYDPQVAQMSQVKLVKYRMLYASLQPLLFLAMGTVIECHIGATRTYQLTFVFTHQWRTMQNRFVVWVKR